MHSWWPSAGKHRLNTAQVYSYPNRQRNMRCETKKPGRGEIAFFMQSVSSMSQNIALPPMGVTTILVRWAPPASASSESLDQDLDPSSNVQEGRKHRKWRRV